MQNELVTGHFTNEEILLPGIDVRCANHRKLLIERRAYLPRVPNMASFLAQAVQSKATQVGYGGNPSGFLWMLYSRRARREWLEELVLWDVVRRAAEMLGGE